MSDISNEPTMEDILSSIKKIISEDSAKVLSTPQFRRLAHLGAAELGRASEPGRVGALSALIVKPDVHGSDTLEGMVREMLRPMLREWLDANLPQVVESLVAKEIARITGNSLG